jgi:hypothetical protein
MAKEHKSALCNQMLLGMLFEALTPLIDVSVFSDREKLEMNSVASQILDNSELILTDTDILIGLEQWLHMLELPADYRDVAIPYLRKVLNQHITYGIARKENAR